MSGELLERVSGIDAGVVMVFDNHVDVRDGTSWVSLRYEEIRSVKLSKGPFAQLTIKGRSGDEISFMLWRNDGLRAQRLIETQRRMIRNLRELGYDSLEDFEAKAAELGKRLGIR